MSMMPIVSIGDTVGAIDELASMVEYKGIVGSIRGHSALSSTDITSGSMGYCIEVGKLMLP